VLGCWVFDSPVWVDSIRDGVGLMRRWPIVGKLELGELRLNAAQRGSGLLTMRLSSLRCDHYVIGAVGFAILSSQTPAPLASAAVR